MFEIAIPTYKRSETLGKKTLRALKEEGFNPATITIFVASDEEAALYKTALDPSLYLKIVVGKKGLKEQRRFISDYYPEGQRLLSIDDDIRRFKKLKPDTNLPELFEKAFDFCEKEKILLWGLYPAGNKYYLKDRFKIGLFLCVGSCFGILNQRGFEASYAEKDDYYLTFECYKKAGSLLRIDSVAVDTTYWGGKGGLQETRTISSELESCINMFSMYPEYVKKVYMKKNGKPDVVLQKKVSFYIDSL